MLATLDKLKNIWESLLNAIMYSEKRQIIGMGRKEVFSFSIVGESEKVSKVVTGEKGSCSPLAA